MTRLGDVPVVTAVAMLTMFLIASNVAREITADLLADDQPAVTVVRTCEVPR